MLILKECKKRTYQKKIIYGCEMFSENRRYVTYVVIMGGGDS